MVSISTSETVYFFISLEQSTQYYINTALHCKLALRERPVNQQKLEQVYINQGCLFSTIIQFYAYFLYNISYSRGVTLIMQFSVPMLLMRTRKAVIQVLACIIFTVSCSLELKHAFIHLLFIEDGKMKNRLKYSYAD